MSKNPGAVDVLYQDIIQLEKNVSDLSAQVVRLQRLINVDKAEAAIGEKQSRTELVRAITDQTTLLNELVRTNKTNGISDEVSPYYRIDRRLREEDSRKRLSYLRHLETCRQEVTPVCPCGEHKGIRFIDKEGKILEELCPKSWWVSQSRIAFEDGKLSSFVTSTPMDVFVRPYNLKKTTK